MKEKASNRKKNHKRNFFPKRLRLRLFHDAPRDLLVNPADFRIRPVNGRRPVDRRRRAARRVDRNLREQLRLQFLRQAPAASFAEQVNDIAAFFDVIGHIFDDAENFMLGTDRHRAGARGDERRRLVRGRHENFLAFRQQLVDVERDVSGAGRQIEQHVFQLAPVHVVKKWRNILPSIGPRQMTGELS